MQYRVLLISSVMDQCADVPSAELKVDEHNSMDTSENDTAAEHSLPNNSEVEEVATPETKVTPEKKGRGSGRKRKSDADMLAEAKATCGHEIDPAEGRQLRKRPDPPKIEKKTPARKPYIGKSKTPNKEDEKETMVENDVKEHVDGVKDDDSHAESAAEQPTNGDDTHKVADEVTDNGGSLSADPAPEAETEAGPPATSDPPEPVVQNPERPVEEETEQKTEDPERITPTESTENSTNNSI